MKKKVVVSALAVVASAVTIACSNGQQAPVNTSVSETDISSEVISDNSIGADSVSEDLIFGESLSENAVSDNLITEEIVEEVVEEPEVEEEVYDILYTIDEIAEMDTAGLTAEELVDLYLACDRTTVDFIKLDNRVIGDVDELVEKLDKFPALAQVDMCDITGVNGAFSNEEMDAINQSLPDTKVVWRIRINRWSFRTDAVAFSTYQPKVITYMMTNKDAQAFKYCTDLRALDLGHNAITDYSFLKYLPELRILIVADNVDRTYGGYVKNLSYAKYCTHLQYFEFFISQVSDLSFLSELKELKDLNLCYTRVSDISAFKDLPRLERLWLNCCGISYDDYLQLQEWHPDAKINYLYAGSTDQGWREHARYYAMRQSFANNYLHELFSDEDPVDIDEDPVMEDNNEDSAEDVTVDSEELDF